MPALTRRDFGKLAAASVPAIWLRDAPILTAWQTRPNSKWAGVQVGMNVPYNFHVPGNLMDGDEVLRRCVQLGTSAVELRTQPVEMFLGSPALTGQKRATPEELRAWRVAVPMAKMQDFKKKFNDGGVLIEIVKVDGIFNFKDDELDYVFTLAKTLGARAISTEISNPVSNTKRLGEFADKHNLMIGYPGHTETGPPQWEEAFGYARHNGANLDIGHFVAGFNTSPVPFLKERHDRITHIHVKDRKLGNRGGENVPFGQGDTPIKEALQLIRDNKWNIQATIEFEYNPPPNPDGTPGRYTDAEAMAEMAKCMEYCKQCLLG